MCGRLQSYVHRGFRYLSASLTLFAEISCKRQLSSVRLMMLEFLPSIHFVAKNRRFNDCISIAVSTVVNFVIL